MLRRVARGAAPVFRGSAALLLAAMAPIARAQQSDQPVNFVFASQLGSGIYSSGDHLVQVYRIPAKYTLREAGDRGLGVDLRFAGALGFYDFELNDLLDGQVPNDVDTFTFMAGVEFPLMLASHWELTPLVDVGYGVSGSPDASSWIYAAGAESRLRFSPADWKLLLGNRLIWAGQSESTEALPDRFVKFDTVFDARARMPWSWNGRATDLGPFAAVYLHASSTAFLAFPALSRADTSVAPSGQTDVRQFEIGLTHGPVERWKVWKIPVPRVGLSYRFGDEGSSVRLVLGGPF